jgi:hypothetical protein
MHAFVNLLRCVKQFKLNVVVVEIKQKAVTFQEELNMLQKVKQT